MLQQVEALSPVTVAEPPWVNSSRAWDSFWSAVDAISDDAPDRRDLVAALQDERDAALDEAEKLWLELLGPPSDVEVCPARQPIADVTPIAAPEVCPSAVAAPEALTVRAPPPQPIGTEAFLDAAFNHLEIDRSDCYALGIGGCREKVRWAYRFLAPTISLGWRQSLLKAARDTALAELVWRSRHPLGDVEDGAA